MVAAVSKLMETKKSARTQIQSTFRQRARWEAAAAAEGLTYTEWIRRALDEAAKKVLSGGADSLR